MKLLEVVETKKLKILLEKNYYELKMVKKTK